MIIKTLAGLVPASWRPSVREQQQRRRLSAAIRRRNLAEVITRPAVAPEYMAAIERYCDIVDAAVAAGERPPLFDPDERYPDQLEPGMTITNPLLWYGPSGDDRPRLNVASVVPDPAAPDRMLIYDIDGMMVPVYCCDPVEVITAERADEEKILLMDTMQSYYEGREGPAAR